MASIPNKLGDYYVLQSSLWGDPPRCSPLRRWLAVQCLRLGARIMGLRYVDTGN